MRRAGRPARGRPGRSWPGSMVPRPRGPPRSAPPVRFVAYGEGKGVAAAGRPSPRRPPRGGRPTGPRRLPPVRPGPASTRPRRRARERARERFTPFLAFPPAGRRVTCTTNAVRVAQPPSRAVRPEPRPLLSSDEAAAELLWPAGLQHPRTAGPPSAPRRRTRPPTHAGPTGGLVEGQVTTNRSTPPAHPARLAAAHPDRINPHLQPNPPTQKH